MIIKETDIEDYLIDASNLPGGNAEKVYLPETKEEIADILREANEKCIRVTISGARTGTVGGAIPFGGIVISLEKFKRLEISQNENGGTAIVGAGVPLIDLQKAVDSEGLFYPPDPTEWSCQVGGTIATNASGARSFKYGSTRNFVLRLRIVLPDGDFLDIKRGEVFSENGFFELTTASGKKLNAKLPTYSPPDVRKNTSGYFSGKKIDAIDIFIGSEGTLGIVTEAELKLLPKPKGFLSGIVFFEHEKDLLDLVKEVRSRSFETRSGSLSEADQNGSIDAVVLEYFDRRSLEFIGEHFPETPKNMAGAIFFEQETSETNEDELFERWNDLLENNNADVERSWFAVNQQDLEKMREFRHALPVAVNERIVKNKQRKVGTDMALPDDKFESFLDFYQTKLSESGLEYVIFGHIGDNHLHANMIPKNEEEMSKARHL
ncbi:MAG: FAD-binding oxidoreductase, partial [Acidobacteria bacterium]|nr:FAD-binding oxidoreductase [Acidobacteriota bacterium]